MGCLKLLRTLNPKPLVFQVEGLGLRAQGLRVSFGVQGFAFEAQHFGFRIWGMGFGEHRGCMRGFERTL